MRTWEDIEDFGNERIEFFAKKRLQMQLKGKKNG